MRACVHSVGMLCGYMPNSSYLYARHVNIAMMLDNYSGVNKTAANKVLNFEMDIKCWTLLIDLQTCTRDRTDLPLNTVCHAVAEISTAACPLLSPLYVTESACRNTAMPCFDISTSLCFVV